MPENNVTSVRAVLEQMTTEQLDELLSRLAAFHTTGNVPQGWQKPNEKPLWSLKLTAVNGLVRTIEAWRLDLFTHVIAVDGTALHTVGAEAVEVLGEGFLKQPGS